MTSLVLTGAQPVSSSSTTLGSPTYTLTALPSYGVWREVAKIGWNNTQADDQIMMTAHAWVSIGSVVSSSTDQLIIRARFRLYDETEGAEAWSGVQSEIIFRTLGATQAGALEQLVNFNFPFSARGGLLQVGRNYTVRLDFSKSQGVGTPTAAVTFRDAAIFGDSATILTN